MTPEKKREYHRKYMRERWYPKNSEKHKALVRASKRRLRLDHDKLKQRPCMDCGGQFPPCVMDWDHVRGEKISNVSNLVAAGARKRADAEVVKADLVCANCHRIRTMSRKRRQTIG